MGLEGKRKMNLLRLSLNLLRRDWRAGEWRVLLLALVLAVGSLATVGLFADRVRQALQQQAQSLIGADLRITSTRPFSPDYRRMAQAARPARGGEPHLPQHGVARRTGAVERDTGGEDGLSVARQDRDRDG